MIEMHTSDPVTLPENASRCATEFLQILHQLGDVFEERILNCPERVGKSYKATAAGWFNAIEPAIEQIKHFEQKCKPPAFYVTLNPCNPDLLSRSYNKITWKQKTTTQDCDILRRRRLAIDIDPVRPADVSSTDGEMSVALATAERIEMAMDADGWPEPLRGMSGNGTYLLYRIDLLNDDESTAIVRHCLYALDQRFSDAVCKIDTALFNAARIIKVLGTWARKGDNYEGTNRPLATELVPATIATNRGSADRITPIAGGPIQAGGETDEQRKRKG